MAEQESRDLGRKAVRLASIAYEDGRRSAMRQAPHLCDLRFVIGHNTYADVSIVGQKVTPQLLDRLIRQLTIQRDIIVPDYVGRVMLQGDIDAAPAPEKGDGE